MIKLNEKITIMQEQNENLQEIINKAMSVQITNSAAKDKQEKRNLDAQASVELMKSDYAMYTSQVSKTMDSMREEMKSVMTIQSQITTQAEALRAEVESMAADEWTAVCAEVFATYDELTYAYENMMMSFKSEQQTMSTLTIELDVWEKQVSELSNKYLLPPNNLFQVATQKLQVLFSSKIGLDWDTATKEQL